MTAQNNHNSTKNLNSGVEYVHTAWSEKQVNILIVKRINKQK